MTFATTKRHRHKPWLARGITLLILALCFAIAIPAGALPEIHPEQEVSSAPVLSNESSISSGCAAM